MKITTTDSWKFVRSDNYNYDFNFKTGYFKRWGKTEQDDPKVGHLEIFDLEIDERCNGIPSLNSDVAKPCSFCYKSNTKVGRYMPFETFKTIFDKLPKTLTQIAFGIGDLTGHPDLFRILNYCRENHVIPNLTTNGYGMTVPIALMLKKYCGGIAVSRYENKDICYNAVQICTEVGIPQVNIHQVIAEESLQQCYELIDDVNSDERLSKINYILFLTLKPKGKRNKWHTLKNVNEYRNLVEYAWKKNVRIGFDSCSAPTFLASVKDHPNFEQINAMIESCESDRFSGYANVEGIWSHCSFTEGLDEWGTIDLKTIVDFEKEVWYNPVVEKFRNCLTCQDNSHIGKEVYRCPVYKLYDDEIGNEPTARES